MKQKVIVRRTANKGRGVYALQDFSVGEIVESCPVINITPKEKP